MTLNTQSWLSWFRQLHSFQRATFRSDSCIPFRRLHSVQTATFRSDSHIPFRQLHSVQTVTFPSDSHIPFRQLHSIQTATFRSDSYVPFRQLHSVQIATFRSDSYIQFRQLHSPVCLLYRIDTLRFPSKLSIGTDGTRKLQKPITCSSAQFNSLSLHKHKAEVRTAENKQNGVNFIVDPRRNVTFWYPTLRFQSTKPFKENEECKIL